jgi:peroxiredoxin
MGGMDSTRHRLTRYAITVAILLAIGGLFVRQQVAERGASSTEVSVVARGPLDEATASVGAPAPDFELATLDGRLVRLSDFRGKTVVVNFWASWCVPCREEMAEFQRVSVAHQVAGDVVVIAVDYLPLDAVPDVRRFMESRSGEFGAAVAFPVVLDKSVGSVAERYGVAPRGAKQAALPVSFFVDGDGLLRDRQFGPVTGTFEERLRATAAPRLGSARRNQPIEAGGPGDTLCDLGDGSPMPTPSSAPSVEMVTSSVFADFPSAMLASRVSRAICSSKAAASVSALFMVVMPGTIAVERRSASASLPPASVSRTVSRSLMTRLTSPTTASHCCLSSGDA